MEKTAINPNFTKLLKGRQIEIILPNGEKHKAQFAIVEMDQILASHNEHTFADTVGYPIDSRGHNVNDRNYHDDKNAQARVVEMARDLEPSILVTTSRTASGTPIISTEGIVVSGNNRTMSLKLAASDYPEQYEEYKQFLKEEIVSFGFKNTFRGKETESGELYGVELPDHKHDEFEKPVLVRIDYDVAIDPYATSELAKYNKETKKAERPIDKAIKLSHILADNEGLRTSVANIVGEFETMSEFYASRADQKHLMDILVEASLVTEQEKPAYYTPETGFNQAGKDLVELLLSSLVLGKEALQSTEMEGMRKYRGILVTSLPVLVKNQLLKDGSLIPSLNQAIELGFKIHASKLSFVDYMAQLNMFESRPDRKATILYCLLETGRNNFKKSIDLYNQSVLENEGTSLFDNIQLSPDDIFEKRIAYAIDKKDLEIVEKYLLSSVVSDQSPVISEKTAPAMIPEPVTHHSPLTTHNLLLRDNWYAQHPEKILGEPYEASGRFGTVIKYRGSIDLLNRIVTGIDLDNIKEPIEIQQVTPINVQETAILEEMAPVSNSDLITEHERLVDVLESPLHLDDLQEAAVQKQELEELKAAENERVNLLPTLNSLSENEKKYWGITGIYSDGYGKMSIEGKTIDLPSNMIRRIKEELFPDLPDPIIEEQEQFIHAVVPTSDINDAEFEDLKLAFPSIKRNENGAVYIPSSANDEKYIRKKALEKNIRLGKLTFVNDLTDLYDVYIEEITINGMKESYDLGFGSLGAGITVWNRKKEQNGSYQNIAHIYEDGSIKYYVALPAFVKKEVEEIVKITIKKEVDLDKKYGLNFETTADGDMVIVTSTLSTTNGEPNTIARINTSNGSFQYKKSFLAPELEEILAKEAKQYENNPSYRKVEEPSSQIENSERNELLRYQKGDLLISFGGNGVQRNQILKLQEDVTVNQLYDIDVKLANKEGIETGKTFAVPQSSVVFYDNTPIPTLGELMNESVEIPNNSPEITQTIGELECFEKLKHFLSNDQIKEFPLECLNKEDIAFFLKKTAFYDWEKFGIELNDNFYWKKDLISVLRDILNEEPISAFHGYMVKPEWYQDNKKVGILFERLKEFLSNYKIDINTLGDVYLYFDKNKIRSYSEYLSNPEIPNNLANEPDTTIIEIPSATPMELSTIISASKAELAEKTLRKVEAKKAVEEYQLPVADMQSFEEVYRLYNQDISLEELRAFIYYKESIGQELSLKWYTLADTDLIKGPGMGGKLEYWINEGILFYHRGQLIPAFLYLAENIWHRVSDLEQDKATIIAQYGQAVYDRQYDTLNKLFLNTAYKNRLILDDTEEGKSLSITPVSTFAQNFKIKTLADELPFKLKVMASGVQLLVDVRSISAYKLDEVAELSLTDAFVVWMVKNQSTIEYKKQVSYVEIYKAYIKQSPRPNNSGRESDEKWKADWERIKENAQTEGERLFAYFLANELTLNDKVRIETEWNSQFNGYIPINYNKIPIAFPIARYFRGELIDLQQERREAVAFLFNAGSGLLGYDVGFRKTSCCIFAIRQSMEAGYAKRSLIAVPNQVYRQFMSEFRAFMPDVPLVDLYNLSADYMEELKGENGVTMPIPEGSVAFVTYEGLEKIGFSQETQTELMESLYEILENVQADKDLTPRQREQFISKIETTLGIGLRGTIVTVEDLGIDLLAVDEAHNMKKVFTRVSSEGTMGETEKGDLKISREKSPYKIESGQPSARGLKCFMLAQYIQSHNNGRNVFLLTATPFTNSPLEVYSMLALTAYGELRKSAINNIRTFFDQYIETAHQLVIDAKLNPVRKQVVTGFRNLPALQQLIFRFINFKNGDTKNADGTPAVNVVRPNKWTLPLRYKMVDGQIVPLSEDEKISTVLPMTSEQADIMADIRLYVEGKISYDELCSVSAKGSVYSEESDDEDDLTDTDAEILDEGSLDDKEKMAVKMLRGISMARNIAISPFLFECYGVRKPSAKEFIESSPKLQYALLCIKQVKDHAKAEGVIMPGQVIYMDRGKEFFGLIKQYFISELGFKEHEIQIVTSGMPKTGNRSKEAIKNLFNGQTYNEATRTFDEVSDSERVKVIIGTSTIKEGMNLQKYATHLYNLTVDWNPTDYQQLEGRIWRQGNSYKNVAIATALVENSMDIFIFQKLEEKSRRINQIWNRDGQSSVFKFEEFNPEDAKYEMISDPTILAKLEIEEEGSKMRDKMAGIESEIRRIVTIRDDNKSVENWRVSLVDEAQKFRTLLGDETIDQLIRKIQNVEQTQLDEEELGKPIKERKNFTEKYKNANGPNWRVGTYGYKAPDWLKTVNAAHRRNKKDEANYLVPRGLTFDNLSVYQGELKIKMDAMAEEIKVMGSENTLAEHIKMVIERKAANKVETRSVQDRAKEAAKLNWIITERLESKQLTVNSQPSTVNQELESCPPTDAKGVLRIDAEAIAQLNRCIAAAPQTKYLHLIEGTEEYTADRKALHKKLIAQAMGDAICIERTKPIAILTGGLPGSGKSTYLEKHAAWLLSDKVMHIDADAIRAELPEYKGWNANATHLETKDIVNELLDTIGKPCNHDLVYDGTMNKAKNYIPLVEKLKNLGYEVFVIYFQVPYEVSMERTLTRYQKTGRYVPTEVITEAYQAGTKALETIKSMVNGYRLIDGVSGETVETGGLPIPADRNYDLPDNANQPTATEKATKLKNRLELLHEMYAEDRDEKLKLRIELLEEMLLELK